MKRIILAAAVSAMILSLASCGNKAPKELAPAPQASKSQPTKAAEPPNGSSGAENIFMKVARDVTPAVVNITSSQKVTGGDMGPAQGDMPHDQYHGFGGGKKEKPHTETSMGSGVIITTDGYILTNAHVVADSTETKVKLSDKREFTAKLVGLDSKTDIAVLKIDAGKAALPKVTLGDSSALEIGQWAIAIGNPFGLDHTVTVGVVSGIGRADVGIAQYENFIQTDASINPGNSGGPLLNSRGEVIGINTAIMSAGQGISFAIPVNMAKDISKTLIEKGRVVRGWLGIGIQTLTPELAEGMGVRGKAGVLVNKVFKDSPAMKGRVETADIVVMFDGVNVTEARQLQDVVAGTKVGKVVDVRILRAGSEKSLRIKIEEMSSFEAKTKSEINEQASVNLFGLTVHPISPVIAEGQGYGGVVVVEVEGGSDAEKAGMMPGDVISAIAMMKITGLNDFRKAASRVKKGSNVAFLVYRAGTPLYIAFKPEP